MDLKRGVNGRSKAQTRQQLNQARGSNIGPTWLFSLKVCRGEFVEAAAAPFRRLSDFPDEATKKGSMPNRCR